MFVIGLIILSGVVMSTLNAVDSKANIQLVQKLASEVYPGNKVLADLTTAQAILESNLGGKPSQLALKYNNLFGIKGKGTLGSVVLTTWEVIKGKKQVVQARFASNKSVEDSLEQRKKLFQNGTKDKPTRYFKVLSAQTFEDAAKAVYEAGYATDKNYTNKLILVYNKYLLND